MVWMLIWIQLLAELFLVTGEGSTCPTGYSKDTHGPCFKVLTSPVNGADAAAACENDYSGSTLATLMSSFQEEWVKTNILDQMGITVPPVWIGIVYDCNLKVWIDHFGHTHTSGYVYDEVQYLEESVSDTAFRVIWDSDSVDYLLGEETDNPHPVLCEFRGGSMAQIPAITCPSYANPSVTISTTTETVTSTTTHVSTYTETNTVTSTENACSSSSDTSSYFCTDTVTSTETSTTTDVSTYTESDTVVSTETETVTSTENTCSKTSIVSSYSCSDTVTSTETLCSAHAYASSNPCVSTVTWTQTQLLRKTQMLGTTTTYTSTPSLALTESRSSDHVSITTEGNTWSAISPSTVQIEPSVDTRCYTRSVNVTYTPVQLKALLRKLEGILSVKKSALSSATRKKRSVWINDPVSQIYGTSAILFICVPLVFIILSDLPHLFGGIRTK